MTDKKILQPSADHPITVEPSPNRVVVTVNGLAVADTSRALVLKEAAYPPVFYIPREDARMDLFERSDNATYCPYKGDASYYTIPEGGDRSVNAIWTYESPYPAVAEIRDHLAFYPDRVDSIAELETV